MMIQDNGISGTHCIIKRNPKDQDWESVNFS